MSLWRHARGGQPFRSRRGSKRDKWGSKATVQRQIGKFCWLQLLFIAHKGTYSFAPNHFGLFLLTYLLLQLLWFLLRNWACSYHNHSARASYTNLVKTLVRKWTKWVMGVGEVGSRHSCLDTTWNVCIAYQSGSNPRASISNPVSC